MKSDTPYKTFKASDFEQLSGLPKETLSKFERLGLISARTQGREKEYSTCDLIRVKFIIRCKKAGYSYEAIRGLIGTANGVAGEAEKIGKCLNYARNQLNRIREQMEELDGLDRLNLQLDDKLISGYIKELSSPSVPISPPPAAKPKPPQKAPVKPKPQIQKGRQYKEPQLKKAHPIDTTLRSYKWGVALLTVVVAGLTVLALYLIDDGTPEQSTLNTGTPSAQQEAPAGSAAADATSEPEPDAESEISASETPPTAASGQPLASIDIKTKAITPLPLLEGAGPSSTTQSAAPLETVATDDLDAMISESRTNEKPSATGNDVAEENKVRIERLKISFNPQNRVLRATFNIVKNSGEEKKVRGSTLLILKPGLSAPEDLWLKIPEPAKEGQQPTWRTRGVPFSIARLKEQHHLRLLQTEPDQFRNATVQVLSRTGQLISETNFPITIQYETVDEDMLVDGDEMDTEKTVGMAGAGESVLDSPGKSSKSSAPQVETNTSSPKTSGLEKDIAETTPETQAAPEVADAEDIKPSETVQPTERATLETEKAAAVPSLKSSAPQASSKSIARQIKPTGDPDAKVWARQSYQSVLNGSYNDAIDAATKAMRLDPGLINPYISRAIAYMETGRYEEAIEDCDRALAINPDNAVALNNRGLAHQKKGMLSAAKSDYRRSCELELSIGCKNLDGIERSETINTLLNQSKYSFENKDWDNVIRATTEVLNIDADNVAAYTNRSAAYAQKGFLNKALKDGNMAIKLDPDFALGYHNRGYVFERLEETKKAAADYKKSCGLGLKAGCESFARLSP